jgi:hypothetical protein
VNQALLPLVVALASAVAATATQAQVIPRIGAGNGAIGNIGDGGVRAVVPRLPGLADGTSNTIQIREALPNSLVTRANVSGDISQTAAQNGTAKQFVSVGGARGLTGSTGNIATLGTLTGNVTQSRVGSNGTSVGEQRVDIGAVAGEVTAGTVDAHGAVLTNIAQSSANNVGGRSIGGQLVDVGSVRNAGGGNVRTSGLISGPGVNQFSGNELSQALAVANVEGGQVQNAQTNGLLAGQVTQSTSSGAGGSQRIGVADIRFAQAQSISTSGTVTGTLTQTVIGDVGGGAFPQQSVAVGSVSGTDAAGAITTNGTVTGAVTQSASRGEQRLLVAAVTGGAPSLVNARATLSGAVSQTSSALTGSNIQRVAIGAVDGATDQVSTDATVGASLTQSLSGTGEGREQLISIASAEGSQGNVSTRAVVNGSISQISTQSSNQSNQQQASIQRIIIGSAQNTGTMAVRTDVSVSGNLSQFANSQSRGPQSILIGGVSAN